MRCDFKASKRNVSSKIILNDSFRIIWGYLGSREKKKWSIDTIKAGKLNKYECVQPMKGKYVGVIIPNKFENLIICELEAFQITGTLNYFQFYIKSLPLR